MNALPHSDNPAHADRLNLLYVCYLTLDDPLTHTQVVAYLAGLAAGGHTVHLVTFERGRLTGARRRHWREQMQSLGIRWHGLRYHKRPSLPATILDTAVGAVCIALWSFAYRIDAVHARTHVPAAMALLARWISPRRPALVFDIRGLMVEEYEEAGRWRPGGLPSRITRTVERAAIERASRIVVLTNRAKSVLFEPDQRRRVHVIPCCANLAQIGTGLSERDQIRRQLGAEDAFVMIYVGKFPSWSMPGAMADFFTVAANQLQRLHFLILTQEDGQDIRVELARAGATRDSYTITSVPSAEVAAYLAASDFAITFIRQARSTIAQSPTKLGEYLGAGLPVVHSAGIGDLDDLMTPGTGVSVAEHTPACHAQAAASIRALIDDPLTRDRCREIAEQRLSLEHVGAPAYLALYRALARELPR